MTENYENCIVKRLEVLVRKFEYSVIDYDYLF